MATRKIKDAKDLSTQELIYFKGHAKATFMSDGATVEDAVRAVENATYKNKGYFPTLAELQSAFPNGSAGSRAYVGSTYPYSIYLWQNGAWVDSGATGGDESVDLASYYTKSETDTKLTELSEEKQDKLISGVTIKTINGKSLLGSGNIRIEGGEGGGGVAGAGLFEIKYHFDGTPLTDEEKAINAETISRVANQECAAIFVHYVAADGAEFDMVADSFYYGEQTLIVAFPFDLMRIFALSRIAIMLTEDGSIADTIQLGDLSNPVLIDLTNPQAADQAIMSITTEAQALNSIVKDEYGYGKIVSFDPIVYENYAGTFEVRIKTGGEVYEKKMLKGVITIFDDENKYTEEIKKANLLAVEAMKTRGNISYQVLYKNLVFTPVYVKGIVVGLTTDAGVYESWICRDDGVFILGFRSDMSKEYAKQEGSYPNMAVGLSANLLGVKEGEPAEFTFRPSDGTRSIKDGFASIDKMVGNTMVWNQIYSAGAKNESGVSMTFANGEIKISGAYSGSDTFVNLYNFLINYKVNYIVGHKYLMLDAFTDSKVLMIYIYGNLGSPVVLESDGFFTATSSGSMDSAYIRVAVTQGETIDIRLKPRLFDLTRMFGEGNEPLTIDEFYARLPLGIDTTAYNEGELINMDAYALKSIGQNQWNEKWKLGSLDIKGQWVAGYNSIVSDEPIDVMPNYLYFFYMGADAPYDRAIATIYYFDLNGKPIGSQEVGYYGAGLTQNFTPPQNARYMKFSTFDGYGSAYKGDIGVYLYHSGVGNYDEYVGYTESAIPLPINTLAADGLKSIGSVADEVTTERYIKRIGAVDMGTLDWGLGSMFYVSNPIFFEGQKLLCAKYINREGYNEDNDMYSIGGVLRIVDKDYTDAASFKAAMSGVMLYYELAEPVITEFSESLDLTYAVWDYGTEMIIPNGKTTPFKGSIIYEFNARDTIRNNRNMVEELLRRVTALETANASLIQQINAPANINTL